MIWVNPRHADVKGCTDSVANKGIHICYAVSAYNTPILMSGAKLKAIAKQTKLAINDSALGNISIANTFGGSWDSANPQSGWYTHAQIENTGCHCWSPGVNKFYWTLFATEITKP